MPPRNRVSLENHQTIDIKVEGQGFEPCPVVGLFLFNQVGCRKRLTCEFKIRIESTKAESAVLLSLLAIRKARDVPLLCVFVLIR